MLFWQLSCVPWFFADLLLHTTALIHCCSGVAYHTSRYNGWSYEEIMLEPLALALAPFLKSIRGRPSIKRLDFGLQVGPESYKDKF
eukprot:1160059-Pelagomonas_calceolata.AAC.8